MHIKPLGMRITCNTQILENMSYLNIQTSTKDAKTKKTLTLENLAKVNAARWNAIEGDILQTWQAQIAAANQTFAGLDEVWEKNREVLKKQFKGERPKSEFAKFYSGYNGSVSNLNHFITIARGKKDAEGNYTGKLFTATDVKKFREAINAANKANKVVKYSRLINLSKWHHDGATIDALTKEDAKKSPVGEKGTEDAKVSGSSRLKISVNGKGHVSETTEGELQKSLAKDASMLDVCTDAFSVLFKFMQREGKDAFQAFQAEVVAKCGPVVAEVVE
jgi:hypothetical protein